MNTVRTPTGIVIGGAYTRPPPQPSADAERLQAALLDRRRPSHILGASNAMRKVARRPPAAPLYAARPLRLHTPLPLRWARALWRWLCAPSPWSRRP